MANDDHQLLHDYAELGSHDAFARITARYINLVYSSALRQLRDRHAAEDVTQSVFTLLARRASRLGSNVVLAGWLLAATRYTVRDFRKAQRRRYRHEHEAAAMAQQRSTESPDPAWEQLAPVLDDALADLRRSLRDAVVLRYFQNQTHQQLAACLGISEEAARQRVSRGIEHLRQMLQRRGVTLTAAALGAVLADEAVQAAPAGLAAATTSAAASAGMQAGAGILKGVIAMAISTKIKLAVVLAILASLVGGGGWLAMRQLSNRMPRNGTVVLAGPGSAGSPGRTWTLTGRVLGPDGEPVSRAEVLVSSASAWASVYENSPARQRAASTETGADGRFQITVAVEPDGIAVRSSSGFGQVLASELVSSGEIRLEPWARIEGVFKTGTLLQPDQVVSLRRIGEAREWEQAHVQHDTTARTDSGGHFVFPRVAPGMIRIGRLDPRTATFLGGRMFEVAAGQTLSVEVGGTGRPVAGRVIVDGDTTITGLVMQGTITRIDIPRMVVPADWRTLAITEQDKRVRAWQQSPEGKAARLAEYESGFEVGSDGSFRIEDVPAGRFAVSVQASFHPSERIATFLGYAAGEIVVPAMPTGRSDQPLEMRELKLKLRPFLRPGQAAAPMQFVTAAGSQRTLADYGGRFLLLHFWSPERRELVALGQNLKHIYDRFGDDPRLAMLAVRIDTNSARLRATTAAPFPWESAVLGNGREVPEQYAPFPSPVFLIAPDGRVSGGGLDPRQAYDLLAHLLTSPQQPGGRTIATERIDPAAATPQFAFQRVPAPAGDHAARNATLAVIGGVQHAMANAGALTDAALPTNGDDPGRNFFLADGLLCGRFVVDLGHAIEIEQINSYSWHKDTRGPQVYKLWAADGSASGFEARPAIGTDPARCGWSLIARVDTCPSSGPMGGQYGVSIADQSGCIGTYRYLLFEPFATETFDGWGQTFFSKINVIQRKGR